MKHRELARYKWHEILPRFDIDEKFLKNKHGPCPLCGGTDRWRYDDKDGYGSYFCSVCGSGEGLKLLMKKYHWSYAEACRAVEDTIAKHKIKAKVKPAVHNEDELLQRMSNLWKLSKPIDESPIALKYLESRNISYNNSKVMRFVTDLDSTIILCKVTGPNGRGCQLHRTYIDENGVKTTRKLMRGSFPAGAAVRLFEPLDDWLGVAEGIETAISAHKQFGVPTWSLLNANNLMAFTPPANIKRLSIFGDNDASFTGQAAAYHLAHKVKKNGIQVSVLIPRHIDTDWNDYPRENNFCG